MTALLGGLSPATFLRDYWQKRPLLVRQAMPGFDGIVSRDEFLALSTQSHAISRLILEHPKRKGSKHWERHDGPFGGLDVGMLPKSHWTLLVHGLESLVPGGWELLRAFSFLPAARIDDLMVSYAADGGSVGPHDDRYDVFLLQGPGRRRWQVSTQRDRSVDPDAAIRVLAKFVGEDEWVLEAGDMLYLPPGVAHYGIAEGPCFTYSIGFLAPTHQDLLANFLGYLSETVAAETDAAAIYEDPDLRLEKDPLAVNDAMIARVEPVLDRLRSLDWDRATVGDFLGRFLTGPKPHMVFPAPARPLDEEAFAKRLRGKGRLKLALPTRGLVRGSRLFLNGEGHTVKKVTLALFKQLVAERSLRLPLTLDAQGLELFHHWYVQGYLGVL